MQIQTTLKYNYLFFCTSFRLGMFFNQRFCLFEGNVISSNSPPLKINCCSQNVNVVHFVHLSFQLNLISARFSKIKQFWHMSEETSCQNFQSQQISLRLSFIMTGDYQSKYLLYKFQIERTINIYFHVYFTERKVYIQCTMYMYIRTDGTFPSP